MQIHQIVATLLIPLLVSQLLVKFTDDKDAVPMPNETTPHGKLASCLADGAQEKATVIGLGDSLTVGIGDEYNLSGYFGRLTRYANEKNCLYEAMNFSEKGFTTMDLLEQLKRDDVKAAIERADVIIFTIGANDLIQLLKEVHLSLKFDLIEKEEKRYAKNIAKVLSEIRSLNRSAEIYYIGFYNPVDDSFGKEYLDSLVIKWNNISEQYVKEMERAHFIAINDLFSRDAKRFLSEDKFHPNHLGYEVIEKRVRSFMLNK